MKDFNDYTENERDSMTSTEIYDYFCGNRNDFYILQLLKEKVSEEVREEMIEKMQNALFHI